MSVVIYNGLIRDFNGEMIRMEIAHLEKQLALYREALALHDVHIAAARRSTDERTDS